MIDPARVQVLNDAPVRPDGKYVLYWMQQSQRAVANPALEYAAAEANALGKPLVVGFGLTDDYPEANERHYAFMLEGLRDAAATLRRERGVKLVVRRGQPPAVAVGLAAEAALVVCDRGYLRHQRRWRDHVADHAKRRVVQVEGDVVVPVEAASDKQEVGARTLRPKLHKLWDRYLKPVETVPVRHPSVRLRVDGDVDVSDVEGTLQRLKVDRSVHRSRRFSGGHSAAHEILRDFLSRKLDGYDERRNDPSLGATSTLAAYLHFGQISPAEVALEVRASRRGSDADRDAFLEELLVRRELSVNFVHYCPNYDAYEGVPAWARKTLDERCGDPREVVYTPRQLEAADTHDPYWNAAQREMVLTGFMHNRMRMYWGKMILAWSETPEQAYETTLRLNNKYFLCGRDPNAYANVAWVFGLHDRPWGPRRPVFGTVRYMNAAGLERKFGIGAYVKWVEGLRG
jgi:deoxyribodipyrimidine photo-lyase